jgi:hypothetical protein
VAGVVANVIDFVTNNYVLAADWQAWASQHSIDPATLTSGSVAGTFIVIDFIFGLLLVWTYAAMRPRFGPGAGTAVISGLVLYVTVTVVLTGFVQLGVLPMALFVKSSGGALVSTLASAIAGAALYKEEEGPSAAFARR